MKGGDRVGVWSGRWACKDEGCCVTGARDPGKHNGMMTGSSSDFVGQACYCDDCKQLASAAKRLLHSEELTTPWEHQQHRVA